jgi:hypothetical protein
MHHGVQGRDHESLALCVFVAATALREAALKIEETAV